MDTTTATHLALRWSISKGRDTYGYNIVTLIDQVTGFECRCSGGGYDMVGTVFGEWLQETHQEALLGIKERAGSIYSIANNSFRNDQRIAKTYGHLCYGMTYSEPRNRVVLSGASGLESMIKIAQAIGLNVTKTYPHRGRHAGRTTGFLVTS